MQIVDDMDDWNYLNCQDIKIVSIRMLTSSPMIYCSSHWQSVLALCFHCCAREASTFGASTFGVEGPCKAAYKAYKAWP